MTKRNRLFPGRLALGTLAIGSVFGLTACGSSSGDDSTDNDTPPAQLACEEAQIKQAFSGAADTEVLLVKSFKKGDALSLAESAPANAAKASNDVCMVKINVGPGNDGPENAPSTSPGIGIEIWLPTHENWNQRIHVKGGGGWVGGVHRSTTELAGAANSSSGAAATTAMEEGAVSATTDTGHRVDNGSFALNADGSINTALWHDFAERGIHEMAVKTKLLTKAYYGEEARYSYFNGFSTGGRQGHKEAQAYPDDFDGILAGAPAFNWSKFITAELYPQIVFQRDLDGKNLSKAQLDFVSDRAINECDVVNGQHLGYIADPSQCYYDATRDVQVLCEGVSSQGVTGQNADAAVCLDATQAVAVNKIWYGQTEDGSAPDPALDNGWAASPSGKHLWYGPTRGTTLMGLAGPEPFPIAADMVALEFNDPKIAMPISRGFPFTNETLGDGENGWKNLSYADLAEARRLGVEMQTEFSNINTDNPDLSAFRDGGGKMLMYHGLADFVIMPQGSINYYGRVAEQMGGIDSIQDFYRFYLIPSMDHGFRNGSSNAAANPPLPTNEQLYEALTRWVEKDEAPETIVATAPATGDTAEKTRPLCLYPLKATHVQGDANQASSYRCAP
ncbi:tannase/feruloyl esterase family alpha/beta hydrolase [Pusillimonas sp. CC-YST705]|uniref:Tannase/feruloyl esterase family alpha/beta hydrolase n=1 Tax=Mesopusillimonas faecipullorum TaxID=2755040 RepID=A0ABS8CEQ8_9BURK|nr:tannase/feruloyl esterase family alpha/beta hydrolase [Mesopusillimonas faecipullorum]MCB5364059.1 tannase/feruloyl esterase family alpha/beta hydrolase [Mesopusillimonas faecipullorum]